MTLPIPRLDDLDWPELVSEGRDRLPANAPRWTDHNISDPGITILELLAWRTDQTSFRLDQITPAHRQRFARLVGRSVTEFDKGIDAVMADAAAALATHEELVELAERHDATSLDEVPVELVVASTVPVRAVTQLDIERIAFATPDVEVVRARAWADRDLALPCAHAPGTVSVVALPSAPVGQPAHTADERRAIRRHLAQRTIVGTRLRVFSPAYTPIVIEATVRVADRADPAYTVEAADEALRRFLHPLVGGPNGRGWPFGRGVYRTELMAELAQVDGVELATSVSLALAGHRPEPCTNLCLPDAGLPLLSELTIEVAS